MKITSEVKIGMMVVIVLAILAVLTLKAGDLHLSKAGYPVKVRFKNVDGIVLNAPVMLNGFEIGTVKKIELVEEATDAYMQLTLWLSEGAKLHEGSRAYVKNLGFMGEKYVGLTSGVVSARLLGSESTILGDEPADLDKLLLDGQEIAKQIKSAVTSINERLQVNKERIDEIVLNMDTSMKHLSSITANLDERLTVNKGNIDEMMANLHSTSINFDQFSYDLKLNPWKLLYRTKEQKEKSIKAMNPTP